MTLDPVVLWDDVTNQNYYISITTILMATKCGRALIFHEVIPPITAYDLQHRSYNFNHVALWGRVSNLICYISTCTRPVDTIHDKVANYCEKAPKPFNMWSREVTWQVKIIKSSILQCPCSSKLSIYRILVRGLNS